MPRPAFKEAAFSTMVRSTSITRAELSMLSTSSFPFRAFFILDLDLDDITDEFELYSDPNLLTKLARAEVPPRVQINSRTVAEVLTDETRW